MRTYVRALERTGGRAAGQGRLPGYSDAVVRHFDAPEALDTRFYEVHAKSALNRVPQRSRDAIPVDDQPVPGLFYACTYCAWGGTAILMADGRTKGAAPYPARGTRSTGRCGVARTGGTRSAKVLDHWMVRKPALASHARERNGAHHECRPSLPDQSRVEARDRCGTGPVAATAPDAQQQAVGHRCVRRAAPRDA